MLLQRVAFLISYLLFFYFRIALIFMDLLALFVLFLISYLGYAIHFASDITITMLTILDLEPGVYRK